MVPSSTSSSRVRSGIDPVLSCQRPSAVLTQSNGFIRSIASSLVPDWLTAIASTESLSSLWRGQSNVPNWFADTDYQETVGLSRRSGFSLKQESVAAEREHQIRAFERHARRAIRNCRLKSPAPLKRINLNWWACFGDDPPDWCRFTHHAAYSHFTGLCSGGKVWRHWIVSQRKLGYMTTPVIVIDGAVIVGFDSDALWDRSCRIQIRHNEGYGGSSSV